MGSAARPPSSRAVKVEIGRQRGDGDDSRRFTPAAITFDTRAHTLTTEIKDDWEEQIKKQWLTNQSHVKEAIIYQFGIEDFEQKIRDFTDLGVAPWSVVALHNVYLAQERNAFVSGSYYSALLGACGLGERILNQLVLTLRDDYSSHPATKHVAGKKSLDDWQKCVRTLKEWGVLDEETARDYLRLMRMRHAAVHYRSDLDSGDARDAALAAVVLLCELVQRIFSPHGRDENYFPGPIGRSYVRRDAEAIPFVKHFILPACVLVSPVYRYVASASEPGGFAVYDDPEYGRNSPSLSDDQFAEPSRASPQVQYPF
jgi:hypothetical protein